MLRVPEGHAFLYGQVPEGCYTLSDPYRRSMFLAEETGGRQTKDSLLRKAFVKILPQTAFYQLVQYFGPAVIVIAGCVLLSWLLERYVHQFAGLSVEAQTGEAVLKKDRKMIANT